jgi:hypothetical protein
LLALIIDYDMIGERLISSRIQLSFFRETNKKKI